MPCVFHLYLLLLLYSEITVLFSSKKQHFVADGVRYSSKKKYIYFSFCHFIRGDLPHPASESFIFKLHM